MQSIIHWGGAILFMLGAMRHGKASNDLYDSAVERKEPWVAEGGASLKQVMKIRHFILDRSSMVIFLIPLAMQAFPQAKDGPDLRMTNAMGLMQWILIFQFAVFFLTYVVDMRVFARLADKKGKDDKSPAAATNGKKKRLRPL